ncbi:hypothetical protein SAMD00079811_01050 [Scytonema sp. HK-05]|nr:hypothetical protein SAMD00079811_01050 [Scytonema sp. HK-05]
MTFNSEPSRQHEAKFTLAENDWKLEQLYADLTFAKQKCSAGHKRKVLTKVEKRYLRGLLCGYSPEQIAQELGKAGGTKVGYVQWRLVLTKALLLVAVATIP